MSLTIDRRGDTRAQVAPFYDAYLAVRNELEAVGKYPYNACFTGRIPGIEGPTEESAIYYLQQEHSLRDMEAKVTAFLNAGGRTINFLDETTKFEAVVEYGFYCGGTGWQEWHHARIVPRNGKPYAVLPKGKRTNGHLIACSPGAILVR